MEQLIFLVVVGALALGKWLFENAGSFQRDETEDIPEAPRRRPSPPARPANTGVPAGSPRQESEEEKMRRFMEALGLPAETPPPARRAPQPKPHPRQIGRPMGPGGEMRPFRPMQQPKSIRPAEEQRPEPIKPPAPLAPQAPSVRETASAMEVTPLPPVQINLPEQAFESATRVSPPGKLNEPSRFQRRAGEPFQTVLREQLHDPAALRRAILLREILGMPKGLQSSPGASIFSPL